MGAIDYATTVNVNSSVYVAGTVSKATPIDFAGAQTQLTALLSAVGQYATNGTTNVSPSGSVVLTGLDSARNVFSVSAKVLSAANNIQMQVPAGSVAIVNTPDASVSLRSCGFTVLGADAQHVLWNMPNATSVSISNLGFPGSLLAPSAAVTFTSGNIEGSHCRGVPFRVLDVGRVFPLRGLRRVNRYNPADRSAPGPPVRGM